MRGIMAFRDDRDGLIHIMEFITSFTIFILVMAVFFSTVAMEYSKIGSTSTGQYLRDKANNINDAIINTPGSLHLDDLPYFDSFNNTNGWTLSPSDDAVELSDSYIILRSDGTAHYLNRTRGHAGTVVWSVSFFIRNSTDTMRMGLYDGTVTSPNYAFYITNSGGTFLLCDKTGNVLYTYTDIAASTGNWYTLKMTKTAGGILTTEIGMKNSPDTEISEIYTIPTNWNCSFYLTNDNGMVYMAEYMEYAPWEEYTTNTILTRMDSLGFARGYMSENELEIKKVYRAQEIFDDSSTKEDFYQLMVRVFGLDLENIHITLASSTGDTTYLDIGTELTGVEDLGSSSRQVKIYSGDNFIGYGIMTVYVIHGGSI